MPEKLVLWIEICAGKIDYDEDGSFKKKVKYREEVGYEPYHPMTKRKTNLVIQLVKSALWDLNQNVECAETECHPEVDDDSR